MEFKTILKRIFIVSTIMFTSTIYAENSPLPPQLIVNIYQAPTPLKALDKNYLVYEIYLTSFMKAPLTLTSLHVLDNSEKFAFNNQTLSDSIKTINPANEKTPFVFQPGESKIIYMWLEINKIPTELKHEFEMDGSINNKNYHFTMNISPLAIKNISPVIVSPPLRGKNWLAGNAPSNTSVHRRTGLIIQGQPYYAQRYAIDFIQMGEDGKSYTGDMHKNTSYHCYNQDVLAVADGTVVEEVDGVPENIPNSDKFAVTFTEKNLPGNHVVMDLGNDKFAGYAHLIPGSLKVKLGDHVTRGQVIGKLGNSGNSSEPHLHFQIIDRGSFLASNGIPYGFTHFSTHPIQIIDAAQNNSFQIKILPGADQRYANQLMLENSFVNL